MIDRYSQIRRIRTLIHTLTFSDFFGEVIVKMESGNIVFVELLENRRVAPEEVSRIVDELASKKVGLNIHPTRTGNATLVKISRKGSLQEVVPLGE